MPAHELAERIRFIDGRVDELDKVVAANVDDIEELRKDQRPEPKPGEAIVRGEAAEILTEFLYGPQPPRRDDE